MKSLSNLSVIICSIVRNAEKGLRKNIPVIDELCKLFGDYRIVVYENDSVDQTKTLLHNWQETDPERIHVIMDTKDKSSTIPSQTTVNCNPFFSKKRITKMANLRNQYMEYVDKKGWTADYLMVVDLDVAQLNLEGILSSFNDNRDWDAVVAFGYSTSPKLKRRYHDTYALTMWGDQMNPQTERKIKSLADELGKLQADDEWIRIASGFGGVAIYRFDAVKGLRYEALPNDDPQVEVKCEHFSIYKQMIERGYDQFYINPGMTLKYQALTPLIIWNSLKRMLGI